MEHLYIISTSKGIQNEPLQAKDIASWPSKNFLDNCIPSFRYGDVCAKKKQSLNFFALRITDKWVSRRSVHITNLTKNSSSSGVAFEEGIFENDSSSEKVEVSVEPYIEFGSGVQDNGLIPNEWKLLQQELYKTKTEKKKELRLQELENARRKEMRAQFLRQKIEGGSGLGDGNCVVSGEASSTSSGNTLANESQQLANNEVLAFEGVNGTLESPVNTESWDPDFHRDTVWKDSVARVRKGIIHTHRAQKILSGQRELDLLFTDEEKLCLQRQIPDFSKTYSEKWPPLHVLAASGQFFFLEQFVKLDIDINELDEDGYTALQRAVLGRKETAVTQLLRAGANMHICDKDGATLLHYGVQTGSLNLVRLLVKRGVDVNKPDEYGWTPLHVAVLTGKGDIVRHLLVSGADKSLKNKDGLTPLDICLALGRNFNSHAVAKALKKLPK